MRKLDKRIKLGTHVQLDGSGWWYEVTEICHEVWIKVNGLMGSFQAGHIIKFTNKK